GLLDTVTQPLTAYLDLTLPSFAGEKVVKVTFTREKVTGDKREVVKYELEKEGGDPAAPKWKFVQPPDLVSRTPDHKVIDDLVRVLKTLSATKIIARKASDSDLERYGLKPARMEATVSTKEGAEAKPAVVFDFGTESDDKQHYYARVAGSDRVY